MITYFHIDKFLPSNYINNTKITEEDIEIFKNKTKEIISILKEFINLDYDNLSNKELYAFLTKLFSIEIEIDDYRRMFSEYNKVYYDYSLIFTKMTYQQNINDGHIQDNSLQNQIFQTYYEVLISNKYEYKDKKLYSKEEIKKLISDKSIVLLAERRFPLYDSISFNQENYEKLPVLFNIGYNEATTRYNNEIPELVLENFASFGTLLRHKFTKKYLRRYIRKIMYKLIEDLNYFYSNTQEYENSNIEYDYKDWYKTSKEIKDFQDIQKKLSLKK